MEIDIDDRVTALHGAFNALVFALQDAKVLPKDRLVRYLAGAANQLQEEGLPEAAAALDEIRAHLAAPSPK